MYIDVYAERQWKKLYRIFEKKFRGRFREARLGIEQLPLTEGKCTAGAKIFSTSGKSVKNRSKVKARPPCHVPLIYAG